MNEKMKLASDAGIRSIKTLRFLFVLADPRALTKSEECKLSGIKPPNYNATMRSLQNLGLATKRGSISAKGWRLVEALHNPLCG